MSVQDLPSPWQGDPPGGAAPTWACTRRFQAQSTIVSIELLGLNQTLIQLGLPIEQLFSLELVLAEILNNVVEHAYQDRGEGQIELTVSVRDGSIYCGVSDFGSPMPGGILPPARRHSPKALALQDLPEGSFGWALIRDLTTGLDYSRNEGVNRLTFRIDLQG
ncbi:ATP-binding protein [Nioella aestuarii]|uniref:ATP-binding protein n=1 Tax=Nioella aestuarii TaxID=1662864 RepID=UPI003D7F2659